MFEHFQANWQGYVAVLACLAPLLFFSRKFTFPVLFYCLEIAAYILCLHAFLYGFLGVASWFKESSAMYVQEKINPHWTVPWAGFWKRDLYNPEWVFYLELAAALLIIIAMTRYRPLRRQRAAPARERLTKGIAPSAAATYDPKQKIKEK